MTFAFEPVVEAFLAANAFAHVPQSVRADAKLEFYEVAINLMGQGLPVPPELAVSIANKWIIKDNLRIEKGLY